MAANLETMLNTMHDAIINYFADTRYSEQFQYLEFAIVERAFPTIVTFVIKNQPRYFEIDPELIAEVAQTRFMRSDLTKDEKRFLNQIKRKLSCTQMLMDVSKDGISRTFEIVKSQKEFVDAFEVPCPRGEGFKRFAVNLKIS